MPIKSGGLPEGTPQRKKEACNGHGEHHSTPTTTTRTRGSPRNRVRLSCPDPPPELLPTSATTTPLEDNDIEPTLQSFRKLLPTLRKKGVGQFMLLLLGIVVRFVVFLCWPFWRVIDRHKATTAQRKLENQMLRSMEAAETFKAWHRFASCLDRMSGYNEWARTTEGPYNYRVLLERVRRLEGLLQDNDIPGLVVEIRSALNRHMAGITNAELCVYLADTKQLILEYEELIVKACEEILNSPEPTLEEKFACFDNACKSFGNSALLLSGGGALGMYHTGVCKALFEADLLPSLISGSSAGAIIAALISTKNEAELQELIQKDLADITNFSLTSFSLHAFDSAPFAGRKGLTAAIQRLLVEGSFMSNDYLQNCLRSNIGDMTFLEAYNHTGRILNISVAFGDSENAQPIQLNYITAPQVVIWSAVAASCSCPGLFKGVNLITKDSGGNLVEFNPTHSERYFDGSVTADLPTKQLRDMFNINFFVVSQTNPHVVPFVQRERLKRTHIVRQRTSWWRKARDFVVWTARLLVGEVGHFLLAMGRIFPRLSRCFVYRLVNQSYTGDITIWPGVGALDYVSTIQNPTPEFMRLTIMRGQRKTWSHVNRLRRCTYIEQVLCAARDRALQMLETYHHQAANSTSPLKPHDREEATDGTA